MSSITFSNTVARSESAGHSTAWKRLWRFDAVCNLLMSDIMTFAAVPLQKTLEMSPDAVTPIRVVGMLLAVYSLLQLWFTRRGEPAWWVYRLSSLDMIVSGAFFGWVLLAGVDMNTLGVIGTAVCSVGSWLLVVLYYTRSRQLA